MCVCVRESVGMREERRKRAREGTERERERERERVTVTFLLIHRLLPSCLM